MSQPCPTPLFREGFALVIGVGQYAAAGRDVPSAERDAEALYATLVDPQLSAYPPTQADLLTGPAASRGGILQALDRLGQRAEPDSTVLIAFTGHGGAGDDGLYYLASADARFGGGDRIVRGSGVSVRELAVALRGIRSRRLLIVLNACFAGVAGEKLGLGGIGSVLPEEAGNELLASGEGRAIITASRGDQRSYIGSGAEHSLFGQALIDGMRGRGVPDAAGFIGLFELYNLLHRQTTRAAARLGLAQEPILTVLQAAGAFPVARYPGSPDPGDLRALADRPAGDTAGGLRVVNIRVGNVAQNTIGAGAVVGDVTIGDTVAGNKTSGTQGPIALGSPVLTSIDPSLADLIRDLRSGGGAASPSAGADDALAELAQLAERLATARNVDEDPRDDAVNKLRQAERAYRQGDRERARARIGEAIALMHGMQNGFVSSLARKVEAARDALG